MDDRIDYLMNFWDPRVGDRVLDEGATEPLEIRGLCGHNQVSLDGNSVAFIQDLTWEPSKERLQSFLICMGAQLLEDSIGFMGSYFPYPSDTLDYADVFRQIRHLAMLKGKPDPILSMTQSGKHIL